MPSYDNRLLLERTAIAISTDDLLSPETKGWEFLIKFIQIHLIPMHTIQTWRKKTEEKNYDVWKVHHQQKSLSQQWQSEPLLQT